MASSDNNSEKKETNLSRMYNIERNSSYLTFVLTTENLAIDFFTLFPFIRRDGE